MCPTGASHSQPPAADLKSAFDIIDVDRDGRISHEDLKTLYAAGDDEAIGTMMTLADLNKDGYVEYEEFENVLSLRGGNNKGGGGVMEDVFSFMDRDGDGKVGEGDLRTYFNFLGIEVDEDGIKEMLRLGDDDDGVTFQGFLKILATF